jgi:hypothetical protein
VSNASRRNGITVGKLALVTRGWQRHPGGFANFDSVSFRVQFSGHLGKGLARVVVPRHCCEFATLAGTHPETIRFVAHWRED